MQQAKIKGALDIEAAGELQQTLLDCFSRQTKTVPEKTLVDLSAVERCDAAGLQVLLAAQRTATANGQQFFLTGLTPVVTATAAALGISLAGMTEEN